MNTYDYFKSSVNFYHQADDSLKSFTANCIRHALFELGGLASAW